ncbi:hypothetical protein [Clostridioides sp. ES-S-0054-01]
MVGVAITTEMPVAG